MEDSPDFVGRPGQAQTYRGNPVAIVMTAVSQTPIVRKRVIASPHPQLCNSIGISATPVGRSRPKTPPPAPPRNGEGSKKNRLSPLPVSGRGRGRGFEPPPKFLVVVRR